MRSWESRGGRGDAEASGSGGLNFLVCRNLGIYREFLAVLHFILLASAIVPIPSGSINISKLISQKKEARRQLRGLGMYISSSSRPMYNLPPKNLPVTATPKTALVPPTVPATTASPSSTRPARVPPARPGTSNHSSPRPPPPVPRGSLVPESRSMACRGLAVRWPGPWSRRGRVRTRRGTRGIRRQSRIRRRRVRVRVEEEVVGGGGRRGGSG